MSDTPDDDTPVTPDDTPDNPPPKDKAPDHEADAKKWKSLALKHEKAAKANAEAAKKLQEMELAGKSKEEQLQALLDAERTKARDSTVKALKLQVAADKGLPSSLAKFLPDVDDEVDMMSAADELLEASGVSAGAEPTRQPKSTLTSPLKGDDDSATQRDRIIAAATGRPVP